MTDHSNVDPPTQNVMRDPCRVVTPEACAAVRDHLFAQRCGESEGIPASSGKPKEPPFLFLAVVPGKEVGTDLSVHVVVNRAAWKWPWNGDARETIASQIRTWLRDTAHADAVVILREHAAMSPAWPVTWNQTAKRQTTDLPVLVLVESEEGQVTGVVMRGMRPDIDEVAMADRCPEADQAQALIARLRALDDKSPAEGGYKEGNVDADSLDTAIATTTQSRSRQKFVVIYRDHEWQAGLWSHPEVRFTGPLRLHSMGDSYGIRVAKSKSVARPGLEIARASQALAGDYDVLLRAIDQLPPHDDRPEGGYEEIEAVKTLCRWWNEHAPDHLRPAAAFHLSTWDEDTRQFHDEDRETPPTTADGLASIATYALFEREGEPTRAVTFYRGRAFNTDNGAFTAIYYADGQLASEVGADLDEVDEAWYGFQGLRALEPAVAF